VIHADRFAAALREAIRDETVRRIRINIGALDQFSDCTDLVDNVGLRERLKRLYQ
jgi:hypothetical protein